MACPNAILSSHFTHVTVPLRIRLAHPADASRISMLSRELIENGLPWRWTPTAVARSLADAETEVIVAESRGRFVGFALMRFGDSEAHLLLFAVVPEFARQGIGSTLMRWLEKMAATAGIERIHLEVRAKNLAAQRFYEALGFERRASIRGYYQGREDAVRMMRAVSSIPA